MADETHKLQKDPPEGSRKVIEHELQRQSARSGKGEGQDKARAESRDGDVDKKGGGRTRTD